MSRAAALLCALLSLACAAPPPVPPRGWSSWNVLACNFSDAVLRLRVDALASLGFVAAGYVYFDVDDCWLACDAAHRSPDGSCSDARAGRDASGALVADPVRFPDGIKALADYVHSRGMRFGMYLSAGNTTCSGFAGSWGHFAADAAFCAAAGADLVKLDGCGLSADPARGRLARDAAYPALGAALRATGRDIVYSCDSDELLRNVNNTEWPWLWGPRAGCDLFRVSGDMKDLWPEVVGRVSRSVNVAAFTGPDKGWADLDFLSVGQGAQSDDEYAAQAALWALLASPMILGVDPVALEADLAAGGARGARANATLALLLNPELLAIADDPLGAQAQRWPLTLDGVGEMWAKPLAFNASRARAGAGGGSPGPRRPPGGWAVGSAFAVGIWNRGVVPVAPALGLQDLFGDHNGGGTWLFAVSARDVLGRRDLPDAGEFFAPPEPLRAHAVGLYVLRVESAVCVSSCDHNDDDDY